MSGTVVSVSGIDSLAHRCIAAMIVHVYGSLATQRISGGQLVVLERVVVGHERFAWGLDTARVDDRAVGPLSIHRYRRVFIWLDPGSLVFGEGADAVPEGSTRGAGAREPRLRRWSTVLVHHSGGEGGHYFTMQATQIWRQMPQVILRYPYAGVDFRGDPDMVLPPGEVFDHRGMLSCVCF
jgi:hypothetical protein